MDTNNHSYTEDNNNSSTQRTDTKKYLSVSNELRRKIIDMYTAQGITISEIASCLNVNYSNAWAIINSYKKYNRREALYKGGQKATKITNSVLVQIERIVETTPDSTLKEIKAQLETDNVGSSFSLTTIHKALCKLLITIKSPHFELQRVNEQNYIEMRRQYALWFNDTFRLGYENAIFVDESPFNLHLKRNKARSLKGSRANVKIPVVRGRSVTLISSICSSGIIHSKVITESSVNSQIFAEYIRELSIVLRSERRVDVSCIIMDNARIDRQSDLEMISQEYS